MKTRLHWLLASLGGAALLAAACAPAARTAPAKEAAPQTQPQAAPAQAAPKPAIQEVKPVQQETVRKEEPAKPAEAKAKTSVSGIPLDPNAKRGGILRTGGPTGEGPTFSNWEEAAGISFWTVHPVDNMLVQTQTWGTLDDYKNLAFFKVQPDLAKSWEQSADGLTWTFKLRDGVKWSDGTRFTCADAKWSFDTIRTAKGLNRSPRAVHFLAVKDIQCADDLTLVFNLKWPKAGFLEVVGMPYHDIRPKHVYENNTAAMRKEYPKVGTGPFTITQWIPGEKYTFARKADYWDQPLPYLEGMELLILSNQALDAGMRAGRMDVSSAQGLDGGRAETMLKECKVCTFYDRLIASSISPGVMLNHQRPPWNDPLVKDAVSLAIDKQKYVDLVTLGWGVVPKGGGFYPTGPWAMPYERVKQIPGYNIETPKENKQRARDLLAQAGYQPGELKVTVFFWSTVAISGAVPPIIEDLQAIGINAKSEILETARAYDTWSSGAFDVGVHGFWVAGLDPDVILYEHFYTGSDRNYNRYSNPKFDRLVDQMSQTIDPELRKRLAWDAMELALREQAKVIVSHGSYMPFSNKDVRGWLPALNYLAGYGPMLRWQNVWLDR